MGKRGNQRRKFIAKNTVEQAIQNALTEDEAAQAVADAEYQSSLHLVYGLPGPPKEDNVLRLPPPKNPPLDALGRKVIAPSAADIIVTPIGKPKKIQPRRVSLMRDHELTYPELWMEVFVLGDPAVVNDEARFAQMFARARCSKAKSLAKADLVVFGGGSDVDPALYGEEKHCTTHFDVERDKDDIESYKFCVENGIPMFGVCRGAQFLHVMNGGKLYQDIDHHYGDHDIWDFHRKMMIQRVSSVHHQMCIENHNGGMELLASCNKARNRSLNPKERVLGPRADVEAFYYRDTACIGVQGHPEYSGYNFYTKWCLELVQELVMCSPDIVSTDGNLRVKRELLEERKHVAPEKIKLAPLAKKEKK